MLMKSESESKALAEDYKNKSCDLVITATQMEHFELSMQHVNSRKAALHVKWLLASQRVGPRCFLVMGAAWLAVQLNRGMLPEKPTRINSGTITPSSLLYTFLLSSPPSLYLSTTHQIETF
jgi:hypothetical protein